MTSYKIEIEDGNILRIAFGEPAQNNTIVVDAKVRLDEMVNAGKLPGGELLKINGPASFPVAVTIAHAVSHLYGAVAVFDPKLNGYVVSVCHDPKITVGDLI